MTIATLKNLTPSSPADKLLEKLLAREDHVYGECLENEIREAEDDNA